MKPVRPLDSARGERSSKAIATLLFYPNKNPRLRLFALWYFTTLIVLWNVFGHALLGFEQSWAQPLVGVGTAIAMQFLLEWIDARTHSRIPRFAGSLSNLINFLPPAIISGIAVAMLMYPNERLWPVVFAATLSIASKVLFRAPVGKGTTQHIFNPSNIALSATFVLFPYVGLAPPYHFTENVTGVWNWVIPGLILLSGIFIHWKSTGRLPLVLGWLSGFAVQGLLRSFLFGLPWLVPFMPMTSAAFILFTLYMIPDPATTPIEPRRQVVFGAAVAFVYGVLLIQHVVFGLFFALVSVCAVRGLFLYFIHLRSILASSERAVVPAPSP